MAAQEQAKADSAEPEVGAIADTRAGLADVDLAVESQISTLHRLGLLGGLVANIEHDLRNPLAFLLTNAKFAEDTLPQVWKATAAIRQASLDPAVLGACTSLETLADDLRSMVHDALVGAQRIHDVVEAMGILARERCESSWTASASHVAEAAVRLVGNRLRRRVRLRLECDKCPPVVFDDQRLLQILVSLLVELPYPESPAGPAPALCLRVRAMGDHVCIELGADAPAELPVSFGLSADSLTVDVCRHFISLQGGDLVIAFPPATSLVKILLPALRAPGDAP